MECRRALTKSIWGMGLTGSAGYRKHMINRNSKNDKRNNNNDNNQMLFVVVLLVASTFTTLIVILTLAITILKVAGVQARHPEQRCKSRLTSSGLKGSGGTEE